ncbi:MAG: phage holin family protein [Actinobacteria bacterium]|nr:phage holin family protein [Actinomycetota bacterium]
MKLLVRWAALAVSFWVATALIPGIDVKGGFTTYLWVALLFGALNATLGSLLKLLTLPAVILTLGLFLIVVNASMLMLVARWSDKLDVTNFWSAIFAAIIISVITRLVSHVGKKAIKP